MLQDYLYEKRVSVVKSHIGGIPDLDIGAGRKPKGAVALDINLEYKPDVLADIRYLPFKNEAVDSLVCSHVIEHIGEMDKSLSEIKRILKKDGLAVFFGPNDGSILWKLIKPIYTKYYERVVSRSDSPKNHTHTLSHKKLKKYLSRFFVSVKVGRLNLGMEIFAVCRKQG